mgnify:CR=1 FL=1
MCKEVNCLNYHELPRLSDSISYIYVEHAIIEQDNFSIKIIKENEEIPIPCASLTVLFLGPGTSITHAAIKSLAKYGCLVVWCGDKITRFYASGIGETQSSKNLLQQVKCFSNNDLHLEVVRRMYKCRFGEINTEDMSLQQLRGLEGAKVRASYIQLSKMFGVKWNGRKYNKDSEPEDEINRAISITNNMLYGVVQGVLVSLGYSPAIGFIHTGRMLSFVYDIADIYKFESSIIAAFEVVAKKSYDENSFQKELRITFRKYLKTQNIVKKMIKDLEYIFDMKIEENQDACSMLWDNDKEIQGGKQYDCFDS